MQGRKEGDTPGSIYRKSVIAKTFHSQPWWLMSRRDILPRTKLLIFSWGCKREAQVQSIQTEIYIYRHLTWISDVIELGVPFTDPIADGPTIQKANTVSIASSFRDYVTN